MKQTYLFFATVIALSCMGCSKEKTGNTITKEAKNQTEELDFQVKNETGKTIFITCFSYIQKERFVRWRWDKSPVYKLTPGNSVYVNIDTIPDYQHRAHTFAYLAVFEDEKEAEESIYELLDDKHKIDLDQLFKLKEKTVVVTVEKYGFKKAKVDFAIVDQLKKKVPPPELDFVIENQTGKTVYVCGFTYQVRDDIRSIWTYDKTPVQKLTPGQFSLIDIDTIENPRDRIYMHGYLAVFDEYEEEKARDATYELLQPKNKIPLGRLSHLQDKKVVLEIEQYGILDDLAEVTVKPISHVLERIIPTEHKEIVTKIEKIPEQPLVQKTQTLQPTKKAPVKMKRSYQLFG